MFYTRDRTGWTPIIDRNVQSLGYVTIIYHLMVCLLLRQTKYPCAILFSEMLFFDLNSFIQHFNRKLVTEDGELYVVEDKLET